MDEWYIIIIIIIHDIPPIQILISADSIQIFKLKKKKVSTIHLRKHPNIDCLKDVSFKDSRRSVASLRITRSKGTTQVDNIYTK